MADIRKFLDLVHEAEIILQESPTAARIANPFLTVRNGHPNTLALYEPYFDGQNAGPVAKKNFKRVLAQLGLGLWRREPDLLSAATPGACDVLLISHLVDINHLTAGKDTYVGDLADRLVAAGYRVSTTYVNHTWAKRSEIESGLNGSGNIVLSRTGSFRRSLADFQSIEVDPESEVAEVVVRLFERVADVPLLALRWVVRVDYL